MYRMVPFTHLVHDETSVRKSERVHPSDQFRSFDDSVRPVWYDAMQISTCEKGHKQCKLRGEFQIERTLWGGVVGNPAVCYARLFFWDFWQNSRRKKLNILTKLKEIWPKLKQNFPKSTQNIQFFFEMVKFFLKKLEKGSKFRSKLKEICRKLKFTGVFVTRGEPKNREKSLTYRPEDGFGKPRTFFVKLLSTKFDKVQISVKRRKQIGWKEA